jgi:hypothetical protein
MADTPDPKLVLRCRNCHHEMVVDEAGLPNPAAEACCPNCGYRNVFGLDRPAKKSDYSPQ